MPVPVWAQEASGSVTGLKIPRFVSLKSAEIYMRSGPGTRYPILWVYNRKNLPVEVINEYDNWRKVRDPDGEEGWMLGTLLSGERTALITSDQPVSLYKSRDRGAQRTAWLESGVIANVEKCSASWCLVRVGTFSGWLEKSSLWGVYENEQID